MHMETDLSYIDKIRLFRRDGKLFIASAMAGSFAGGITGVIFTLYLKLAFQISGIEAEFLGVFLSISMFTTAAVAILAGMVSDRVSRKKTVIIASIVSLIAAAIQYSTLDRYLLVLSQVLIGVAGAFSQVALTPYITDLSTERERAHLFGVSSSFSLLGVLLGNITGGFLPVILHDILVLGSSEADWLLAYRYGLWFTLIPLLFSALFIVFMSPDSRTRPHMNRHLEYHQLRREYMNFRNVKSWGFILRYSATVSTVGFGAGMIVLYFNIYFQDVFNVSTEVIGLIFAANTLVLAVGNLLTPAMADRIGKVMTVVITESLSIPFLLVLAFASDLNLAIVAYISRNVLMNMAGPVSNAFFMEGLGRHERSTALGLVRSGDSAVRGVAAIIGGWLLAMGAYRLPYLLVVGLYILAVVMFYSFFRRHERLREVLRTAEPIFEEDRDLEAT